MKTTRTAPFRFVSHLLTLLLALGQAPAFAASPAPASVPAGQATADALAPAVTSLQMQFEADLAATSLSLVAPPKVGAVDDMVSQVSFLAAAPLDLSRSGRLVHAKDYYLVSNARVPAVATTQEVRVDVDVEKQHVDVTTLIGFDEAFDGREGRPAIQGLKIENVVEVPLEEYRRAVGAAVPQQAFQELGRKLEAQESQVSRTSVILPDGRRTTFRGSEMTLAQAVDRAIRGGNAGLKVSFGCVRDCLQRAGIRIGIGQAVCLIGVVGVCGASCFIVGPACIACFQTGFLACNIGVGAIAIVAIVECLLRCR
jgi:hypothetical protein